MSMFTKPVASILMLATVVGATYFATAAIDRFGGPSAGGSAQELRLVECLNARGFDAHIGRGGGVAGEVPNDEWDGYLLASADCTA